MHEPLWQIPATLPSRVFQVQHSCTSPATISFNYHGESFYKEQLLS